MALCSPREHALSRLRQGWATCKVSSWGSGWSSAHANPPSPRTLATVHTFYQAQARAGLLSGQNPCFLFLPVKAALAPVAELLLPPTLSPGIAPLENLLGEQQGKMAGMARFFVLPWSVSYPVWSQSAPFPSPYHLICLAGIGLETRDSALGEMLGLRGFPWGSLPGA